jgi:hypothetical protein
MRYFREEQGFQSLLAATCMSEPVGLGNIYTYVTLIKPLHKVLCKDRQQTFTSKAIPRTRLAQYNVPVSLVEVFTLAKGLISAPPVPLREEY